MSEGHIVVCRRCNREFKVPHTIMMVFPHGYDHSCCAACNRTFKNVPDFEPIERDKRPRWRTN